MSDSENEYEAMLRKNLKRKQELLAELGLDSLLNEGRQLFAEIRDQNKPRSPVRKKSAFEEKPARRSVRIQKKSYKVKYVKGFRGFDGTSDGQQSSDDSDEEPSDRLSSVQSRVHFPWHSKFVIQSKPDAQDDLINSCADRKEREEGTEVQENKNENHVVYAKEESDDEKIASVKTNENMIKTMLDKEVEVEAHDLHKKTFESVRNEPGICDAPVVKNSESLFEEKDHASHREKLMKTVNKTFTSSDKNMECSGNYKDIEWNDRSEEACKQIILNYFERSVQFKNYDNEETDSEDDWSKYEDVVFCISASDDSDSSVDGNVPHSRRRKSHSHFSCVVPALSCEDVTEEILANIAKRSSCKVYDQLNGTTCHQCRQKTFDTKTVCRSGRCVGVRGMFCGTCLPKRYGEQVADALKNPEWECPVCRGICNCSFCRARAGKNPTGIMYPEARQQGYNCVAEYLKDKDKENIRKEKKLIIMKS